MKPFIILSLVGALAGLIAPNVTVAVEAQTVEGETPNESIGVATMKDDGTIVLRLRAKTPHGIMGEWTLVYPPTHPQYQNILSHIGPIGKGQTVPVKPWPD